jgi:hypothetical protein
MHTTTSGPVGKHDMLLNEVADLMARRAIRDVVLMVANNPLLAFPEKHLRADLLSKLWERPELSQRIATGIKKKGSKDTLLVSPLQKDYGSNHAKEGRISIAILNPVDISHLNEPGLQMAQKKNGKSVKRFADPVVGIEVLADRAGGKEKLDRLLEDEVKKLKGCGSAYVLAIARDNEVKGKSEGRLTEFREAVKGAASERSGKKKVLGLVVHGASEEVELFDGEKWWDRDKAGMVRAIAERRWTFGL